MKASDRQDIFRGVGQALGFALVIAAQHPPDSPARARELAEHLSRAALDPETDPEVSVTLLGMVEALRSV